MKMEHVRRRFRPFLERLEDRTAPATFFVATTGSDTNPGTAALPFLHVQHALDVAAANPGPDTINVASGTYVEQLTVSSDVTLTGAGAATTTIQAPPTLTPDAQGQNALVEVNNAAMVNISNLTIQGPNPTINSGVLVVGGATANVTGTTINQINQGPANFGVQTGRGIQVGSTAGGAGHATITNCIIINYQKTGILTGGTGTTVTITGTAVTGVGGGSPLSALIAQNGIQISAGTIATVTNNTVGGNVYTGPGSGSDPITATQSVGIFIISSGGSYSGNTVSGNDIGIDVFQGTGNTISTNVVQNNNFENILFRQGMATVINNIITGSKIGAAFATTVSQTANSQGTLTGNTISGASTAGIQLLVQPGASFAPAATITGNNIEKNLGDGISVQAGSATVTGNEIQSNSGVGLLVSGGVLSAATGNCINLNGSDGIQILAGQVPNPTTDNDVANNTGFDINNLTTTTFNAPNNFFATPTPANKVNGPVIFLPVAPTSPCAADLALTKTVDNPSPIFGTPVTFTLTVTNQGPDTATRVVLADTLPNGLNFVSATPSQGTLTSLPPGPLLWNVGTLANGASAVLKLTVQVAALGLLVNNAGVGTNDQFDPNLVNNLAQVPITVIRSPGQISKFFFLASTILDPPADPPMTNGSVGSAGKLTPTLPFTDTFTTSSNRPQFSPFWTDRLGTMIGINDQPIGVGDFNLSTVNGISQANAVVTADTSLGAGQTAGLVARYRGPGYQNFYLGQLRSLGNGQFQAAIFANIGGTFYTLAVGSTVNSGTGTLEFEVVGSSLKLLLNNQLVAYAQDTSITAPGSVGMRLSQGATVSNFAANTVTAATAQSLPFTDNFTSSSDGFQLASNWSDRLGNVTVVNGQATGRGAFNLSTVNGLDIGSARVTAQVTVNPGGNAGLVARYGGPGYSNFYLGQLRALGNGQFQAAIFTNIGGVFTTIAVGTTTATTGTGTLEFEVVGSSLKLIFNNTLLASGFDTSLTAAAGGSAGIRLGEGATASTFSADQMVLPTAQTLPFTDSFSNPGDGSQLSTNWSDQNGNITVTNGAATGAWDFNQSTVNGINVADVTVAGDINLTPGAGQSAALVARYSGPLYGNFYLAQFRDIGNGQYQAAIFKNIGGTFSLVTLGATTTKNAGRLTFKLTGSVLEVDLDNTLLARVVDTSITGSGSVGMRLSINATMKSFSAS